MSKGGLEYIANKTEFNLISKEDVALMKIKLGKSHRKESDWDVIKGILLSHNVIVIEHKVPNRKLPTVKHILCEDGFLIVFTNIDDCEKHIRNLNFQHGKPDRVFRLGVMPFSEAVDIAEGYGMDLYIDFQAEVNTTFSPIAPLGNQLHSPLCA